MEQRQGHGLVCTVQEGPCKLAEGVGWPLKQRGWSLWPGRRACRPRASSAGTRGTQHCSWHWEECRKKMQPGVSQCCMAGGWEAQAVNKAVHTLSGRSPGQPSLSSRLSPCLSLHRGTLHYPVCHSVTCYWNRQVVLESLWTLGYFTPPHPFTQVLKNKTEMKKLKTKTEWRNQEVPSSYPFSIRPEWQETNHLDSFKQSTASKLGSKLAGIFSYPSLK